MRPRKLAAKPRIRRRINIRLPVKCVILANVLKLLYYHVPDNVRSASRHRIRLSISRSPMNHVRPSIQLAQLILGKFFPDKCICFILYTTLGDDSKPPNVVFAYMEKNVLY